MDKGSGVCDMFISDFYLALIIGLVLSLLVSEIFGVVPGGTIVPGYLALVCDTPIILLIALSISFVVFGITKYLLPKLVVLYGRRRFVANIILSVIIKLGLEFAFPLLTFASFEFRGVGVIVPALIANCYNKQGIKLTILSVIPVTLLTFCFLSLIYYYA